MITRCAACGVTFDDFADGTGPCPRCGASSRNVALVPYGHPTHPTHAPYPQPINVIVQNQIFVPYPPPHAPPPYYPSPVLFARRKDSTLATVCSFFLPGGGQLYNGQIGKGLAFLLGTLLVNLPLMTVGIGFFTLLVTWIWSMVDAHGTAERINRGQIV